MVKSSSNGWRSGSDPMQRWLRIITTIVVLGVFVYLNISPEAGVQRDIVAMALALGAVLILLGYEGLIKLPMLSKDDDKNSDKRNEV